MLLQRNTLYLMAVSPWGASGQQTQAKVRVPRRQEQESCSRCLASPSCHCGRPLTLTRGAFPHGGFLFVYFRARISSCVFAWKRQECVHPSSISGFPSSSRLGRGSRDPASFLESLVAMSKDKSSEKRFVLKTSILLGLILFLSFGICNVLDIQILGVGNTDKELVEINGGYTPLPSRLKGCTAI